MPQNYQGLFISFIKITYLRKDDLKKKKFEINQYGSQESFSIPVKWDIQKEM